MGSEAPAKSASPTRSTWPFLTSAIADHSARIVAGHRRRRRREIRGDLVRGARRWCLTELHEEVDQLGRVDERAREVRARSEDRSEQAQDRGLLFEQAPDRPRLAALGDRVAERTQRLIRIRRCRDLGEQCGADPCGARGCRRRQRRAGVATRARELGARSGDIAKPEAREGSGFVVRREIAAEDLGDLGAIVGGWIAERREQRRDLRRVPEQLEREGRARARRLGQRSRAAARTPRAARDRWARFASGGPLRAAARAPRGAASDTHETARGARDR